MGGVNMYSQSCANLSTCQQICNPDFSAPDCAHIADPMEDLLSGQLLPFGNNLPLACNSFDGWTNYYNAPQSYIITSPTYPVSPLTPSGDGEMVRMVAGAYNSSTPNNYSVGIQNNVDINPNTNYLLNVTYAVYGCPFASEFLCDDTTGTSSFLWGEQLRWVYTGFTNASDISWTPGPTNPTILPINYVNITPSGLGTPNSSAPLLTNLPKDNLNLYVGLEPAKVFETWHKSTFCFTTGSSDNWDTFFLYPRQLTSNEQAVWLYLDRLSLIEDDFPNIETSVLSCIPGDCVTIGSNCDPVNFPDALFTWEVLDNGTWLPLPNNTPSIDVCPTETTTYRLTRALTSNSTDLVIEANCFDNSIEITAEVSNPFSCCINDNDNPIQFVVPEADPLTNTAISQVDGKAAFIVPSSTTWNENTNDFIASTNFVQAAGQPIFMNVDLVIPNGVELTIETPMNMFFAPDCRILVQQGGKLNVGDDIATVNLRGICDIMWQGIQVEGPGFGGTRIYDGGGNNTNFGIFTSRNTLIEDAFYGVVNTKVPHIDVNNIASILSTNPDFVTGGLSTNIFNSIFYNGNILSTTAIDHSGGLITIGNGTTEFYNCLEAVVMPWYNTSCNNPSTFDCECIITDAYIHSDGLAFPFSTASTPSITETGIQLIFYQPTSDDKLIISDNTIDHINYAVKGVQIRNTDFLRNDIDDCTVGFSVINAGNANSFAIQNLLINENELDNCTVAMQLAAFEGEVTYNNINNNFTPIDINNLNDIGIFLMGSAANVNHNRVYYNNRGVALLNNQTTPVNVRNNIFFNNPLGVDALGDNTAVQITCNDFDSYFYALVVRAYTSGLGGYVNQSGMVNQQGDCDPFTPRPADNLFIDPLDATMSFEIFSLTTSSNDWIYNFRNQAGYIPATAGFVTPLVCASLDLLPREASCDDGMGMLLSDQTIAGLAPGNILNTALFKKVQYYVEQGNSLLAKDLLEDVDNYLSRRLLTNHYLIQADITTLNTHIGNLPNATEEQTNYRNLYQWYADLKQSNRTIFDITPTEETELRQIAASYTQTSFEARAMLYLLYGEQLSIDLPPLDELIDPTVLSNININFKHENNIEGVVDNIVIYPNPAKNFINIDFDNPDYLDATINIHNLTGQLVHRASLQNSYISTENFDSGVYYYTIVYNNELVNKGKLVILQ